VIFLPIAERELRVTARKRSTSWLRVLAALVALVIGAAFLAMNAATGTSRVNFGRGLFGSLTWLALATTLGAGLFLTSDALSEEKREGTLGFLFLTDLAGFDVVAGKLLATSLRGGYSLLAIFPILGVTLLMGGVTGGQFWRCTLALLNALFCSLAAGLLVSSVSRDSQRAMAGTFLLLLLLCAAGPILDASLGKSSTSVPQLSWTSPVYVFQTASAWGRTGFWPGLLTTHALGWLMLGGAAVLVRRTWQDRPAHASRSALQRRVARRRTVSQRRLLEPNPVVWLTLPARWQSVPLWALALGSCALFLGFSASFPSPFFMVWSQVSRLLTFGVYLWTASQASRFLVEARRSGLLELLLVTPLSSRDIVAGQWRALLRAFAAPVLLIVLLQAIGALLAPVGGMFQVTGGGTGSLPMIAIGTVMGLLAAATTLANLVALTWVGMWMGLTHHTSSVPALKSFVFVQVLPSLGISVASTLLAAVVMFGRFAGSMGTPPSNALLLSFPFIMVGISAVLTVAKDAAFFVWARRRLRNDFCEQASRASGPKDKFVTRTVAGPATAIGGVEDRA
jgi:ABC-type transport system involved in multi-copper enzyme maturation permease subunit